MTRFPLRSLRLLPGEEHQAAFHVSLEPLSLGGQTYTVSPRTVVTALSVQRATSGHAFRLQFAVDVTGPCMRCLDAAAAHLRVDVREYHDDDPAGDDELVSDYVADDHLEISSWARDSVVLGLPDPILCRADCAGLCPTCGKNLNAFPHEHPDTTVDPRWAALQALRDDG